MRRRDFMTLLSGGVALTLSLIADAQQAGKLPTIACLSQNHR
jgi:hypothetical protein